MTVGSIVVQGNRRVEADTIRSYFRPGPGGRLDAVQDRRWRQGALRHRPVPGRAASPCRAAGSSSPWSRTRSSTASPSKATARSRTSSSWPKSSRRHAARCRGRPSRPTCRASSRSIGAAAASTSASSRRSSSWPNNRVDLVFEITEGGKTGVKRIDFVGNKAYSRLPPEGRDQDLADRPAVASCRPATSTTRTAIEADRDLLRRFYLKHGFIDVRIVSAIGEYDPRAEGLHHHLHDRGRRAVQVRHRSTCSRTCARSIRRCCGRSCAPCGRRLQRRTRREVGRGHDDRGIAARLSVRDGASARRPQSREPHRQRRLRRRRRPARLHRAHQHPRQHAHARLCDPARVRHRRGRCLQPRAGRSRRAADEESRPTSRPCKITNEPGSAPDRVIINVDVEEQSTGEFSVVRRLLDRPTA